MAFLKNYPCDTDLRVAAAGDAILRGAHQRRVAAAIRQRLQQPALLPPHVRRRLQLGQPRSAHEVRGRGRL